LCFSVSGSLSADGNISQQSRKTEREKERESERERYRRQTDLTVKPLFIADDLECNADVELVIIGVNNLTKAAFAKHFVHLIAIGNVISRYLQQNHQLKPVK